MKVLNLNKSVKEFNEDLKAGLEYGCVLNNIKDNRILLELCANLVYYLKYFLANAEKEIRDNQ